MLKRKIKPCLLALCERKFKKRLKKSRNICKKDALFPTVSRHDQP